jgi:hypothetical protein
VHSARPALLLAGAPAAVLFGLVSGDANTARSLLRPLKRR